MVSEIFEEMELGQSVAIIDGSVRLPYIPNRSITRLTSEQVKFSYVNAQELQYKNIDFKISELNCIVGRSGSGKSSLTNLLTDLFQPNSGTIKYYANDLEVPTREITFSYCSQQPVIFDGSVEDNLIERPIDYQTIFEVVNLDFLSDLKIINPKKLSGGERQRIGIARALNVKSDIYIFDEPTASLDDANVQKFITGIVNFSKNNLVIIVTHDARLISQSQNILNLK